jgi:hypothetical protein
MTFLAPATTHVATQFHEIFRGRVFPALFLLLGIYSIVHGLMARKFSFRSRGGKIGEERVEFSPRWKDRLLVVFAGLCVAIVSLIEFLGLRGRH